MSVKDLKCGCRIYSGRELRMFARHVFCTYHEGATDYLALVTTALRQRPDGPDYVHEHNVMLAAWLEEKFGWHVPKRRKKRRTPDAGRGSK